VSNHGIDRVFREQSERIAELERELAEANKENLRNMNGYLESIHDISANAEHRIIAKDKELAELRRTFCIATIEQEAGEAGK
jgi:hypothetical protein